MADFAPGGDRRGLRRHAGAEKLWPLTRPAPGIRLRAGQPLPPGEGNARPVNSMRNLITDVAGVQVGQAGDARLASGVTAVVFEEPAVAGGALRGGGPGTRDTELLDPAATVERVDAITLSGGSAFGLDAAAGVQAFLAEQGRGFAVGSARVPIVPGAILFDLDNGGDKAWGRHAPYRDLGYEAAADAAAADFALGTAGAAMAPPRST